MGPDRQNRGVVYFVGHGGSYSMLNQVELAKLLLTLANNTTIADCTIFLDVCQSAQRHNLELEQIESRFRDTPFASLIELLPRNRAELYAFLALLVAVAQLIVSLHASSPPTITPGQVIRR
jgi:hypothetical protein